jgi:neutral ceramidase
MPLGVSMAGYGGRFGKFGPYAEALAASDAQYDRFFVKTLVLDDGITRLYLVRSPMCWVSDYFQTQVAQYVIEKTGVDITNNLVMTATHTHSGPARFWYLLPELKLGVLGYGNFLPEVFRRLVASFGESIIAAEKDLKPARLGYTLDNNFDPEDRIFSDRRGASPKSKQPVLLVMRVDREDGSPLAAVVNFPMHGTAVASSKFALTQDAAGGVEYMMQDYFEARKQKRVEAFFMQGPAGDISPRGGHLEHDEVQKLQMIGHLTATHAWTLYENIQPQSDITLGIVNKRIGISRELIGYKDDEFYEEKDGKKTPYRFGALQCVTQEFDYEKEPNKRHQDGQLKCGLIAEFINNGAPIPQFTKTHLTAVKIGGLTLATFPGEVTSFLAIRLREALQTQSGGKLQDVITLGYSQDHHFYLLDEEDWWRGGYEASMNIWGPRFGEYILKEVTALALQLADEKKTDNKTRFLPQDFFSIDLSPTVPREKTPNAGKIVTQPPKNYERLASPFTFTVSGGFQGVDNPRVTLQSKQGGSFQDVLLPGGRPYDDSGYRMIMRFEKKEEQYLYHFDFEELEDFPLGSYRFRIEGKQWDGEKSIPYTVETDEFEIVPSKNLHIWDVKVDDRTLLALFGYPPSTNDKDAKTPFTRLERIGHRLRATETPWDTPKPLSTSGKDLMLEIEILQANAPQASFSISRLPAPASLSIPIVTSRKADGSITTKERQTLATQLRQNLGSIPAGEYTIRFTLTDAYGNQGSLTQDITLPE